MDDFFDVDLRHVGLYGAVPSLRRKQAYEETLAIPFAIPRTVLGMVKPGKIGVFAHIFHVELAEEIGRYLSNIPGPFDIWATTDSDDKAERIREALRDIRNAQLFVRIVENRGRDIAPFLVGCRDEILKYDYVLHIHGKKSKHDSDLYGWRTYLFDQLLGSPDIVASNLLILQNSKAGIVFPDHFKPVRPVLNFGSNYDRMKALLAKLGAPFSKDVELEFPSGSMFWASAAALKGLLDLDLKASDFPPEAGQIDGEIQHALERILVYAVERTGRTWARVVRPQDCEFKHRLLHIRRAEDIAPGVHRATRHLLGNRMALGSKIEYFDEINRTGLRPDYSKAARFSLLTPTLKPEKTFGGVATAIRLFNEIHTLLPEAVQGRIISLTDEIDQNSMQTIPAHILNRMDAHSRNTQLDAVDISAKQDTNRLAQLSVSENEIFVATAWWTAQFAARVQAQQKLFFGKANPFIYLIQDHEPDFYGWSSRYAMAQATYSTGDFIAVVNSEELANFFTRKYAIKNMHYLPYRTNQELKKNLVPLPKERIILIYGRPETRRNAFELMMDGICLWQQEDVANAKNWQVISVGEQYSQNAAPHVQNLTILGKLTLEKYANMLSRSSVGISLMLSPHPSYPPLEMAEAGLLTLANSHESKNLQLRNSNIRSLDVLTPENIAAQLTELVRLAEPAIGTNSRFSEILPVATEVREYSAQSVVDAIQKYLDGNDYDAAISAR